MQKNVEFPEDVDRICKIAYQSGYYISPLEAQSIWRDYSDGYCAGWLILPEDDHEIWKVLQEFFEVD